MSDLHTKMTAQHFTTDEVIRLIMDILGDGAESDEEYIVRGRGMLSLIQSMSLVTVPVTNRKKVLKR